jgi:hypothetical protein
MRVGVISGSGTCDWLRLAKADKLAPAGIVYRFVS